MRFHSPTLTFAQYALGACLVAVVVQPPWAAATPGYVIAPVPLGRVLPFQALAIRADAVKSPYVSMAAPIAIPYITGIMHGHLIAAMRLVELGLHESAVMHSSHPIDENFADLEPLLPAQTASALRRRLATINELIALKAPRDDIVAAYQSARSQMQAIEDEASGTPDVPDGRILALIVAWLTQAAEEYEEAWSGLNLENAVEYQDGYGFYTHAKAKLMAILPRLQPGNRAVADEIARAADRIGLAWPAVIPPDKPALATSTLRALVAVIEINARRYGG